MKSGLQEFQIIDTAQIWLAFSPEYEKHLLLLVKDYSYEAARWNAYLNRLCLNAFISWVKEYLALPEILLLLPSKDECYQLWEFLNGTAIQVGETRIVLIPTEDSIVEEFCVQREWVDIPGWEANYYISIQVNPEKHWLRVLGCASHNTIKEKAEYDEITRSYCLSRNQLIVDLNFMWIKEVIYEEKKVANNKLAQLSLMEAKKLLKKSDRSLWCSPRLDFDFEKWAALLADENLRKLLYNQRLDVHDIAQDATNLTNWLQGIFDIPWQTLDELLGPRGNNLAFAWRGREERQKNIEDQAKNIPALIEILQADYNEETRLKVAKCLGAIAPGNLEAIAALIDLLNTSQSKWTRWQAAESLGEIGTGNQQAITALTAVLNKKQDDELCWQAALSLGKIDPSNPKAGVSRCRQIDLGMQLAGHPVALLVYLMPEANDKIAVLLKVHPAGKDTYLPQNLQLIVLDESGAVFDQAQARSADNWIQLSFTYQAGDNFHVKVTLGDVSHTEEFVS
ncbi:DUF1822 family protein [Scytonema sp. UIC 10036]|uniref:DUF1822 family protein n=1 Tax=Scytonema sp. UIC 10036 TaxID=2304196 RepID=UPI0012DA7A07|nr:DUF1822 family protein [Scytonema sp. UIC 10036]MUG97449.1 DUF1822 family protein [Scytonema sp. UIC 10036]